MSALAKRATIYFAPEKHRALKLKALETDLPPLSSRPSPAVIPTCPRCHLDRRERSHAAIIRPKKGILGNTRFLAALRNDRG
ncbi:MAG: hypothetical protein WBN83_08575, partial [Desulfoprunum sp.]